MSLYSGRTDIDKSLVTGYYDGDKKYYDQNADLTVVKLYSGDYYVSYGPKEMVMTILGSCVAACIRDPILCIGGMNHFLLPDTTDKSVSGIANESTRYGVFAMEKLVNELLKRGAVKSRLEVKLFGGANVTDNSALIGFKNVAFIKEYVKNEGLRVVSEDLGGDQPRRIHYYTDTGKVMMRVLKKKEDFVVVENEKVYKKKLANLPIEGDAELF